MASGVYRLGVELVHEANHGVADAIRPVEKLISEIIAPDGRTFSVEELSQYGWPPGKLWEIDADYL